MSSIYEPKEKPKKAFTAEIRHCVVKLVISKDNIPSFSYNNFWVDIKQIRQRFYFEALYLDSPCSLKDMPASK